MHQSSEPNQRTGLTMLECNFQYWTSLSRDNCPITLCYHVKIWISNQPNALFYRDAGHEILQLISVILLQTIWQYFFYNSTLTARTKFPYRLYTNVVGESFGGHHTHTIIKPLLVTGITKSHELTSQGWLIME